MNSESSKRADSLGERAIASAAVTPRTIDRPVDHIATTKLLRAAKCNCHAFHNSTYQRAE